MKQINNYKSFTNQKDPKDVQIDKLKNELKTEKSKTTQMKNSLKSIHTIITKYSDFNQS